jgi:hypothetical protein
MVDRVSYQCLPIPASAARFSSLLVYVLVLGSLAYLKLHCPFQTKSYSPVRFSRNSLIFIFKRSPSASERFYISLQPHFSVPVFCFLLQFVGPNLGPNLNRIFLCVSFAFCCNLWDLNFIFPLLLFAAICSILGYSKKFPKTTDFQK